MSLPTRSDLTDGVVLLRQPREADIEAIALGAGDPLVAKYTVVPSPYTEQDARDFVSKIEQHWDEATAAVFGIFEAEAPADFLGMIGLHDLVLEGTPGGSAEIGYWMSPGARRRGLATRAVRLVSTWAIDELGLARIQWCALPDNDASRIVAESVGYRVEGTLRLGMLQRGLRHDQLLGSLLPADLIR